KPRYIGSFGMASCQVAVLPPSSSVVMAASASSEQPGMPKEPRSSGSANGPFAVAEKPVTEVHPHGVGDVVGERVAARRDKAPGRGRGEVVRIGAAADRGADEHDLVLGGHGRCETGRGEDQTPELHWRSSKMASKVAGRGWIAAPMQIPRGRR